MKDCARCIGLLGVGLLTATVTYPLLHEAGHAVTAIMVGARVTAFQLFPVPFVVCDVSAIGGVAQAVIGVGGIAGPYIVSMMGRYQSFWLWYVQLLMKGISVYTATVSAVAVVLYMSGIRLGEEDIVKAVEACPAGLPIFLGFLTAMSIGGTVMILKEKPFARCAAYFEIPTVA